jgi:hypothetical protein
MTKLLEQAIEQLCQLPEDIQDSAARVLLWQLDDGQLDDRGEVAGRSRTERD